MIHEILKRTVSDFCEFCSGGASRAISAFKAKTLGFNGIKTSLIFQV
jgi:hypothetical protein